MESHNIDPWMQFFKSLLDRPMPAELETFIEEMTEIELRDKHILWEIKGLAARMTYRVFQKYGNPTHVEEEHIDFSKYVRDTFAVPLLESHLQIVFKKKS